MNQVGASTVSVRTENANKGEGSLRSKSFATKLRKAFSSSNTLESNNKKSDASKEKTRKLDKSSEINSHINTIKKPSVNQQAGAKIASNNQCRTSTHASTVLDNRAGLYKEFLDLGYNPGDIKVDEEKFNSLIGDYAAENKNENKKRLDDIKSRINGNAIWDDSFKGRENKAQLTRRVDASIDTVLQVRKQLNKMTTKAITDKKTEFELEDKNKKPRYDHWLEEQGNECKALAEKIHKLQQKAKEGRIKFGSGPSLGSYNKEAYFVYREMEKLLEAHKRKLGEGVKFAQKSSKHRVSSFEDFKEVAKQWVPSLPTNKAAIKKSVVNTALKTEQKVRGVQHAASKLAVQEFKAHHIVNDPRMASIVRAAHAELLLEVQGIPFDTSSFSAMIDTLNKLPSLEKKAILDKVRSLLSEASFNTDANPDLSEKVMTELRDVSVKGKALISIGRIESALEQLKSETEEPAVGSVTAVPEGSRHRLVYFTTQLLERTKTVEVVADRIEREINKEKLNGIVNRAVEDSWLQKDDEAGSDEKREKEFKFAIKGLKSKVIPTMVNELGRSAIFLREAVDLVTTGEGKAFESAGVLVKSAASQATSTADEIRFSAAEKAGKDINPFSKRSRIAKDIAIQGKEAQLKEAVDLGNNKTGLKAPNALTIQKLLKEVGKLEGESDWGWLNSDDDPDFVHFATRVAKEWELAIQDRTVMPTTPEECANQEKAFLEFMADWGQRKALREIALALLEDKVDIATFGISKLVRGLSTALIGGVTTYLKLHAADEGVMPGNDYPYKEKQQILHKNIREVAVRLILTALPNTAQAAIGGGAALVGRAHNARVDLLGEGQKHQLKNLAESAVDEVLRSAASDGLEAIVDVHIEESTEAAFDDRSIEESADTTIDVDDVAKLERYPGEVKSWVYEGPGNLSIQITGTEDYFNHVSSVLDDLAETETGKLILQALEGQSFSICFPEEVEYDGISVHPASTNLDNNVIYFDPLNTLSYDSESAGGDQPKLTLSHELIHILDKENLVRDSGDGEFTPEEKSLLEHMAVGIIYDTPDGEEVDFSDPDTKKKYLKDDSLILTVNQLRNELNIEERSDYTEGDNFSEGRLHFQYPDNSNLKTEVSLYRSWQTLEKQIEETKQEKEGNPDLRFIKEAILERQLNRLRAQLDVVNNQMARFKGEVPNIERLAYAKLWLAEARAESPRLGGSIRMVSDEEIIAEKYLEQVNNNIEDGWNSQLDQAYKIDSGNRTLTVDEFKRETIEELRKAYSLGDCVKAYTLILSKLESVNEKLDAGDWGTEAEHQVLLKQKDILTKAEAIFINQAASPGIPEIRHLFLLGDVQDAASAAGLYYGDMDNIVMPDGTVITSEEQRALIDLYGGPEEFAEHMQLAHEHNKALSMSETLTPDQFLLMIAERTLEENERLPPEGIDTSFLDKKVTVEFQHVDREWSDGETFTQDKRLSEKEFTVKEIILGKHTQHAKSLAPAPGNGYCSVESMTSTDPGVSGLENELDGIDMQNEYMDHVDDLKDSPQFMEALQHRLKTQLYQKLVELGADKEQLVSVGVDHQPDRHVGHRGRLSMNSVFAIQNDNSTYTFFSLLSDKTFTTTNFDEENAWTNEQKGREEAHYWLRDPNSEFHKFISAHIDPKERFSPSDYNSKLAFFDHEHEDVLLQRHSENFMDFMKNWMDVNSRSEGEKITEAFTIWVNELGKAWTAATDFLPLPIKFLARMGFTVVQGSLNMANAETQAEIDEAGRNMGYSMGKVAAFSAASGFANPRAMTNLQVFPSANPVPAAPPPLNGHFGSANAANVIGRGPVAMGTKWGGVPSADDRLRSTFSDPDKGYNPASEPTPATESNAALSLGKADEIWSRMIYGQPRSFEATPEPQSEEPSRSLDSFFQGGGSRSSL